jgi:hypothetical protein
MEADSNTVDVCPYYLGAIVLEGNCNFDWLLRCWVNTVATETTLSELLSHVVS